MIVLGADIHKSSHTIAAVDAATGQLLDDKTILVGDRGFVALLGGRAAWRVSGSGRSRIAGMSPARFERFLSVAASASSASRRG